MVVNEKMWVIEIRKQNTSRVLILGQKNNCLHLELKSQKAVDFAEFILLVCRLITYERKLKKNEKNLFLQFQEIKGNYKIHYNTKLLKLMKEGWYVSLNCSKTRTLAQIFTKCRIYFSSGGRLKVLPGF